MLSLVSALAAGISKILGNFGKISVDIVRDWKYSKRILLNNWELLVNEG